MYAGVSVVYFVAFLLSISATKRLPRLNFAVTEFLKRKVASISDDNSCFPQRKILPFPPSVYDTLDYFPYPPPPPCT